ncbi:MAG: DUF4355 domain-containing protein [Clostridia bacterium]|nr:DUF4355 domain-containing protein [Clostridia bacterium]
MMNKNNLKEQKHEGQEKVYTQEEFEKKLSQMKAQWEKENEEKILSERDDAAKMATMSADERARAEMEKRQKAFDAERSQYMLEKMEFEAGKELAKHNLPLSFAKLLSGNDIDDTISNIDNFKQEFLKAVEAALAERLKGATPKTGNAPAAEYDPFLSGFGL